jgi:nucleotide-binding universal stress UspA family protein
MTMRVLLATDGSDDARAAAAWLAQCPFPEDTRLRVVSVVSIPPSALDIAPVRDFNAALRKDAAQETEAASAPLRSRFASVDTQVLEGDAREAILQAAAEWPADLVVLGARGLGAVAGFLLGSVSLGVTRHAGCSVLVVKHGVPFSGGIVIGVDGSAAAAAAAAFVARLPLDPATPVQLVGIVQSPTVPGTTPYVLRGMVREAIAGIVKERTQALEQAITIAAEPLSTIVKNVDHQVIVGHPAQTLLDVAARRQAGLIVVGARGLGAVKRLLLGSTSESVLRHADRPVLIVRSSKERVG